MQDKYDSDRIEGVFKSSAEESFSSEAKENKKELNFLYEEEKRQDNK